MSVIVVLYSPRLGTRVIGDVSDLLMVNVKFMILWNVTKFSVAVRCQCFEGTCCLSLHGGNVWKGQSVVPVPDYMELHPTRPVKYILTFLFSSSFM